MPGGLRGLAVVAVVLAAAAPAAGSDGQLDAVTEVEIAGGHVWSSSITTAPAPGAAGVGPVHRLERFDPATLERTAGPITLPAAWSLAAGSRRLWVAGRGGLEGVDPASARIAARVSGLDWAVGPVAVGTGVAWLIEPRTNRLRRVDTARGRVVRGWTRPSRLAMQALALDRRRLWVVSLGPRLPRPGVSPTPRGRGVLYRLDAATGRVTGRLTVGRGPAAVATGFGSVWVMNAQAGTLLRVDPRRLMVRATIRLARPRRQAGPGDLAVGPDLVWAADAARGGPGTLRAIDPRTNRIVASPLAGRGGAWAVAVAAGPEGAFVALSGGDRRLCRVVPRRGGLGPCAP